MHTRKKYILGNWKMNLTSEEIQRFFSDFNNEYIPNPNIQANIQIGVAAAFPYLEKVKVLSQNKIITGAQNIHFAGNGAYTGEVSPVMLNDLGISFALVGHSERRQYFGETSKVVAKRAAAAIAHNIIPIICIGETHAEFEAEETFNVIQRQLIESTENCFESAQNVLPVIAYEPVWAIGTGLSASSEQVNSVHRFILNKLSDLLNHNKLKANSVSVIYGGSVNAKNCKELSTLETLDGFLIGGSSLKPAELNEIIRQSFN